MFTCQYCGTQFTEHRPNCPNCGATLKMDAKPSPRRDPASALEAMREICAKMQGLESVYFEDAIQPKRMENARARLEIPAEEKVILLYDDTVFNAKNDVGFAICERGLYWRNDWSVETKRRKLSWEEFTKRSIRLDGLQLDLEMGDAIGMAGCGSDEIRAKLLAMLRDIQALFQ